MTTTQRRLGVPLLVTCMLVAIMPDWRAARATDPQTSELRTRMRGVFATLTRAYKYSLDTKAFESPENRDRVQKTLEALANSAADVEAHTGELDPSFDYLKRSLARDARTAVERFSNRQYVGARWVLSRMTENCVTCHSKLPAERTFDLGEEFLREVGVDKLPPSIRVELQVASRQFDAALDTYELMFRDPKVTDMTLSLIGAYGGYLRICIGVRNNTARPTHAFKAYLERDDLSNNTRRLVAAWIEELENLRLQKGTSRALSAARKLVRNAQLKSRFPGDQTQLVDLVAAAALLHRYLNSDPRKTEDVAEAYYLLGVAESYISKSYWISETAPLLEQAIRTAPKSPVARDAYAFLESYTLAGHQVTARGVPENVRETLDSLRRLIEN